MIRKPPARLVEAINQGTATVKRRVAFYQSDSTSLWLPGDDDLDDSRLLGGGISLDYTRDERRSFDAVLNNVDKKIFPDPYGGFWYDKILKFYKGYTYPAGAAQPKIGIIEEAVANSAYELRNILYQLGFQDVTVDVGASTVGQLGQYDIAISYTLTALTLKSAVLAAAFDAGVNVITVSRANSQVTLPDLISASSASTGSNAFKLTPTTYDTPLAGGWSAETYTSTAGAGARVTTLAAGALAVSTSLDGATTHYTGIIKESASGAKWFDLHVGSTPQAQGKILLQNALKWIWSSDAFGFWEVQLGEFMIDNIDYETFPHQISVNGRDFTKKCMLSKFPKSLAFEKGTDIRDIVSALAANAGITKTSFHFRADGATADDLQLDSRLEIARETSRWEIMKNVCTSYGFELFFDSEGYLTARTFKDPSTDPISHTFKTGNDGDLSKLRKSLNDSRIFNDVVITGERGANKLPYFGRARNVEPDSPTSISRLGDRPYFFTSSHFKSDDHCKRTAERMLKIQALESYELAFESLHYPWQEVGEIVKILDPDRTAYEPTRYLLTNLSLPLGLGVMSGNAKRVTIIKSESDYTPEDLVQLGVPGIDTVEQAQEATVSPPPKTSGSYSGKLPSTGLQ